MDFLITTISWCFCWWVFGVVVLMIQAVACGMRAIPRVWEDCAALAFLGLIWPLASWSVYKSWRAYRGDHSNSPRPTERDFDDG